MTGHYLYPRLDKPTALRMLATLRSGAEPADETSKESLKVPGAAPRPTGGVPVTSEHLQTVREAVRTSVETSDAAEVSAAEFDRRVSAALFDTMRIVPGDAGSLEVWNYMGLVALPRTSSRRFPMDKDDDRFIGSRRHVLRRLWFRRQVLGDLLDVQTNPLAEDELVQLSERQIFLSDPRLARFTAEQIFSYPGPSRSHRYSRPLFREIQAKSGPVLLTALTDHELRGLVKEVHDAVVERIDG
jgi:hypothetical protein